MSSITSIRAAALLSAVLLAACNDSPTSPESPASSRGIRRGMSASDEAPGVPLATRHSMKEKYRQQTRPFGSNRSGTASLSTRALLGRDGAVTLDVTTGELDASSAPGAIVKAQIKLFDASGAVQSTRNVTGLSSPTYSTRLAGRPRHSAIQVQANVRGIDAKRTDVVTVDERVNLRPDIAVSPIDGVADLLINRPTIISSVISEENGDVGATTNCVLYVDGAVAQRIDGVWVAEGDAVACVFTHAFTVAGAHQVELRAESVQPGDWDLSNNRASAAVTVANIISRPPQTGVPVLDEEGASPAFTNGRIDVSEHWQIESSRIDDEGGDRSSAWEYAYTVADSTFSNRLSVSFLAEHDWWLGNPVAFRLDEWNDNTLIAHHFSPNVMEPRNNYTPFHAVNLTYADGWILTLGTYMWFDVERYRNGGELEQWYSIAVGRRYAVNVLYQRDAINTETTGGVGGTTYWTEVLGSWGKITDGENNPNGVDIAHLGGTYRLGVKIVGDASFDQSGFTHGYEFDHTLPIGAVVTTRYDIPRECSQYSDPFGGWVKRCTESAVKRDTKSGSYYWGATPELNPFFPIYP